MMNKIYGRRNNGGARKGAGRKKGVGKYFILKKVVHDTFEELYQKLMASDEVKNIILEEIKTKKLYLDTGKVYIVRNLTTGLYKIGYTTTKAKARLSHFYTNGKDVQLICMYQLEDYNKLEQGLHEMHKDKNVHGEWYKFNESEILEVISYLTAMRFKDEL